MWNVHEGLIIGCLTLEEMLTKLKEVKVRDMEFPCFPSQGYVQSAAGTSVTAIAHLHISRLLSIFARRSHCAFAHITTSEHVYSSRPLRMCTYHDF